MVALGGREPAAVDHDPRGGRGRPGRTAVARRRDRAAERGRRTRIRRRRPPRGTGVHRYVFVVRALDVPSLDLDPGASPASLGNRCFFHGLARGILTGTANRD